MRDLIVSIESMTGHFWEFWLDSTYTTSSRLNVAGGVRTKLTCDGLLDNQFAPAFHTADVWNTGANRLDPKADGDFYTIRVALSGASDAVGANQFEVELDVGGSAGVIFQETEVFAKGTGDQSFNIIMPIFVGADFLANGGEIFITPLNDADFWQSAIAINRTYAVPI
jgi:hypothetical protein